MKRRRRRRRRQMRITKWFKSLKVWQKSLLIGGTALLCLMATFVIYLFCLLTQYQYVELGENEIYVNELDKNVGAGYTNIALFGGDSRSGKITDYQNTDTIIVASINNKTKEVKLVSVYRDTLLDLSNGKIRKANSAYGNGGAKMAINMLNMNLDLDIKKFVTVDFGVLTEVIDMLGGIRIDVSEAERKAVNKYIEETGMVANNYAKKHGNPTKKIVKLTKSGLQTLDGIQATTYARIRKGVGNDYARTERQRLIIEKIVEKAKKSDLGTIKDIIDTVLPNVATNFELSEIMSYAMDYSKYSIGETTGFPFEKGSGNIPGKGDSVFPITLKSNVSQLHEFLYGSEDYVPSSKVADISKEIAYIVGNKKPDSGTGTGTGSGTGNGTGNDSDSEDGTTTEPGDGTTTEPGDGTTTEPGDGTTTEPGDGTTTEPGDGTTTEPGDGTTAEPGDGTTTEPGDGTTTEPGDGTTTEPGDGTTTEPGDGTTTEPGADSSQTNVPGALEQQNHMS